MSESPSVRDVAAVLAAASTVGVVGHVGPDGDALGSMVALAIAARDAGKTAIASFDEPFVVPEEMKYLDLTVLVPPADFPDDLDAAVAVDTSVPDRVGKLRGPMERASSLVVIDHHPTDGTWGDVVLIDPSAAATTELVQQVLDELGWPVTPEIASALYTGIVTDTGRFQYSNTTPHTHRIAADLLEHGIAHDRIGQSLFEEAPFGYFRVAARVLDRAVMDEDHGLVWSTMLMSDLDDAGIAYHETDPLIDLVRLARGSEVACLLKERSPGVFKGSLRSRGTVDVSAIARSFGGGGHHNASGFTSSDPVPVIIGNLMAQLS